MSDPTDHPRDLTMIGADDQLLDLLAAGERPEDGDEVGVLLAAWRADLAADLPTVRRAVPGSEAPAGPPPAHRARPAGRTLRIVLAAAAVLAVVGGITLGAGDARPGSPLWPLTRVLYADRADSAVAEQAAEQAIADARQAITDAHYSDADKLLDEAAARAGRVRDPTVAQRLRAAITALRGLLPGGGGSPSGPPPGTAGGPAPSAGATAAATTAPGGGLPTGLIPSGVLPSGIIPSGVIPSGAIPSGVVPTGIIPSGVIPTSLLPLPPGLP